MKTAHLALATLALATTASATSPAQVTEKMASGYIAFLDQHGAHLPTDDTHWPPVVPGSPSEMRIAFRSTTTAEERVVVRPGDELVSSRNGVVVRYDPAQWSYEGIQFGDFELRNGEPSRHMYASNSELIVRPPNLSVAFRVDFSDIAPAPSEPRPSGESHYRSARPIAYTTASLPKRFLVCFSSFMPTRSATRRDGRLAGPIQEITRSRPSTSNT